MVSLNGILYGLSIGALPVLLAITLHEAAHGWVALQLGDDTAERLGRVTLNPLPHIHPLGTIVVPIALLLAGSSFLFGWARPVPVDIRRLNQPKRDMAIVAAAGPVSNLIMALCWGLVAKWGLSSGGPGSWLMLMGQVGIIINLLLCVLNLLPIPPLDGGRVMVGLLPTNLARMLARVEPFGFFILIGLLFTGLLAPMITPVYGALNGVIKQLFGLG